VLLFVAAVLFSASNFFRLGPEEDRLTHIVATAQSGGGGVGTDEYAPPGADNSTVASGLPDACLVDDLDDELGRTSNPEANPNWTAAEGSCLATASATLRQPEHLRIALTSALDGFVVLRLRSYPAWKIKVNDQLVADLPARADGLIVVPVPRGRVALSADWSTTGDILLARSLSCVAVLLMLALAWWERRAPVPTGSQLQSRHVRA
jgi:hypothetical protein